MRTGWEAQGATEPAPVGGVLSGGPEVAEWPAPGSTMARGRWRSAAATHAAGPSATAAGSAAGANGRKSGLTMTAFIRLIPLYCLFNSCNLHIEVLMAHFCRFAPVVFIAICSVSLIAQDAPQPTIWSAKPDVAAFEKIENDRLAA